MKKILCIILAILLPASLGAAAFAETDSDESIWRATQCGFALPVSDAYREEKGYVYLYFVDENGVVLDGVVAGALPERYPQILEKLLEG